MSHNYKIGLYSIDSQCFNSHNPFMFGFNGKEKDDEGMGGGGYTYDYGFRIYNPQIARFLSVDPLTKEYPWYTPYQFAGNNPILNIDLDGLEELDYNKYKEGMQKGEAVLKNAPFIGDVKPDFSNNKYWTPARKGFQMTEGTKPSDALNDIFTNPKNYPLDCGQYSQCLKLRGIQEALGDDEFNKYIGDQFHIKNHESTGVKNSQIYDFVDGKWFKMYGVPLDESGVVDNFNPNIFVQNSGLGTEFTINMKGAGPYNVLKTGDNQYVSQHLTENGGAMTFGELQKAMVNKAYENGKITKRQAGKKSAVNNVVIVQVKVAATTEKN